MSAPNSSNLSKDAKSFIPQPPQQSAPPSFTPQSPQRPHHNINNNHNQGSFQPQSPYNPRHQQQQQHFNMNPNYQPHHNNYQSGFQPQQPYNTPRKDFHQMNNNNNNRQHHNPSYQSPNHHNNNNNNNHHMTPNTSTLTTIPKQLTVASKPFMPPGIAPPLNVSTANVPVGSIPTIGMPAPAVVVETPQPSAIVTQTPNTDSLIAIPVPTPQSIEVVIPTPSAATQQDVVVTPEVTKAVVREDEVVVPVPAPTPTVGPVPTPTVIMIPLPETEKVEKKVEPVVVVVEAKEKVVVASTPVLTEKPSDVSSICPETPLAKQSLTSTPSTNPEGELIVPVLTQTATSMSNAPAAIAGNVVQPKINKNKPNKPAPKETEQTNDLIFSPNTSLVYTHEQLLALRGSEDSWSFDPPAGLQAPLPEFFYPALKINEDQAPTLQQNKSHHKGRDGKKLGTTSLSASRSSGYIKGSSLKVNATKVQMSATGYKLKVNHTEDERKMRAVQFILNKLSDSNMDKMVQETRDLELDRMDLFKQVITMLFDKAVGEPKFGQLYATFCSKLRDLATPIESIPTGETNPDDAEQQQPTQPLTFPKLIVQEAQETFQQNSFTTMPAAELLKLPDDEQLAITVSKRRYLDTMKFLGELYRAGLMKAKHIVDAYKLLLDKMDNEEALEAFCTLFAKTGKPLITSYWQRQQTNARSDGSYDFTSVQPEIAEIVLKLKEESKKNSLYAPRMRYMMMDTVDAFYKWLAPEDAAIEAAAQKKQNEAEERKIQREKERKEKDRLDKEREKNAAAGGNNPALSKSESNYKKGRKGTDLKLSLSSAPSSKSHYNKKERPADKDNNNNNKGGKDVLASQPADKWSKQKTGQKGSKSTPTPQVATKVKNPPKAKKAASKHGGAFGGLVFDDDDEDEDDQREEEDQQDDEEEEEQDDDEEEEEANAEDIGRIATDEEDEYGPYFTDHELELLEVIPKKFISSVSDYEATNDPADIQYSFNKMNPEDMWLVAYSAFACATSLKKADIDLLLSSTFWEHIPVPPADWDRGFARVIKNMSDLVEEKPIITVIIAQVLKCVEKIFPFSLEKYEEDLKVAMSSRYDAFIAEYQKA